MFAIVPQLLVKYIGQRFALEDGTRPWGTSARPALCKGSCCVTRSVSISLISTPPASVDYILRRRKQDSPPTLCPTTNPRPPKNTGPYTDPGHRTCLFSRFAFHRTSTPSYAARLPRVHTSLCLRAHRRHSAKSFPGLGAGSPRSAEELEDRVRGEASCEGEHCSPEDDRKLCGEEACNGSACQRTEYPIKCQDSEEAQQGQPVWLNEFLARHTVLYSCHRDFGES